MVVLGAHSHAGPEEGRMAEDQLGRDESLGHQPAVAVDVGEDQVEEGDPLGHRRLETGPFGLVDDQRARIEQPRPAPALVVDA